MSAPSKPCGDKSTGRISVAPRLGGFRTPSIRHDNRFQRRRLLDLEALQDVAHLYVVEIRNSHAALESGANFVGIVLEPSQRDNAARVDHHVVPEHTYVRVALENTVLHRAPGDRARTLHAEDRKSVV